MFVGHVHVHAGGKGLRTIWQVGLYFFLSLFDQVLVLHGDAFLGSRFASRDNFIFYRFFATDQRSNGTAVLHQQLEGAAVGFMGAFKNDFAAEVGIKFFLRAQKIVDNAWIGFARTVQCPHVFVHQFGFAVTPFISLYIIFNVVGPPQGTFGHLNEFIGLLGAYHSFDHFAVIANKIQGWISRYGIGFLKTQSFGLLHVNFKADEVFVEKSTHFFRGEYAAGHHFTGSTPGGKGIHKNGFFLLFGLGQCFFPAAVKKFNALANNCTEQE